MRGREIDLRLFRLVVRFSLLLGVASAVFGIYMFLQGRAVLGFLGVGGGVALLVPSQYFRVRPDPAAARLLVLLSKRDCSLCDEARIVLRTVIEGTPFTVQEIDIASHRTLRRQYKNFVPVVLWQGDELAKLRVAPDELRARLADILAHDTPPGAP